MAIHFTFSNSGTSRFAQVISSIVPKFSGGKEVVSQHTKHGLLNISIFD